MLGSLFQHHDIDGVIVGADRVVKNGDTANKVRLRFFSPVIADLPHRSGPTKLLFWPNDTIYLSWSSRP